jgi:hypothetical protein
VLAALSFSVDGEPIWWFTDSLDDIAYQAVVRAVSTTMAARAA